MQAVISKRSRTVLTAGVAMMLLAGCRSEAPYTDNSQDPLAYARDIKAQVQSAARNAKSSNEPVDYLAPVLLELKRTDRPLGSFGGVYTDLRSRLEKLVEDCERTGRGTPNLSSRLDELIKVAQTLPDAAAPAEVQ
jgi:hypothetical protein